MAVVADPLFEMGGITVMRAQVFYVFALSEGIMFLWSLWLLGVWSSLSFRNVPRFDKEFYLEEKGGGRGGQVERANSPARNDKGNNWGCLFLGTWLSLLHDLVAEEMFACTKGRHVILHAYMALSCFAPRSPHGDANPLPCLQLLYVLLHVGISKAS